MIGQQPDILPWNPSLPYDRPGAVVNQGCPEGYFAQFVGAGEPGAIQYPGGSPSTWVRCRLMASTSPETIVAESGVTADEALAVYTQAVADTVEQAAAAVKLALPWAVIAVGAFALWYASRR